MKSERKDFASKLGLVLATAGSAVGLGNIWRFPVEAGNNGGGAFIILYIVCVLVLGIPMMTAEFIVGRSAHTNASRAFQQQKSNRVLKQTGKLSVWTAWFILCYYIVISGWILDYLVDAVMGKFSELALQGNTTAYENYFNDFISNPYMPIVYMVLFMGMTHYVIIKGVQKGIERFSKLLMPLLFILLVLLAVNSVFTSGAAQGMSFLFKPDFSKITGKTILAAMGQAFFSLSVGMGCLSTYSSYFSRETKLVGTALKVSVIDTLVAILAGIVIFPAVFSAGIQPDAGSALVFIALPNVFQQVFGDIPLLSYAVSVLFYFLLLLATLTSAISIHEPPTVWMAEEFNMTRKTAANIITAVALFVGVFCSLSMGVLNHIRIFGKEIFGFFDSFASTFLLPVCGMMITVFVGWYLNKNTIQTELAGENKTLSRLIVFSLRYIIPPAVLLIFLSGTGIFDFIF